MRYVYLADGTFVNEELVRQGFAQIATFPPDVAMEATIRATQKHAIDNCLGLWTGGECGGTSTPTARQKGQTTLVIQPTGMCAFHLSVSLAILFVATFPNMRASGCCHLTRMALTAAMMAWAARATKIDEPLGSAEDEEATLLQRCINYTQGRRVDAAVFIKS